ncbi:29673_t:CDS:2, partial [Racocetra persica]
NYRLKGYLLSRINAENVKGGTMTKTELILKQTCPHWKKTLHEYYQQQIILHLASEEAQKEG